MSDAITPFRHTPTPARPGGLASCPRCTLRDQAEVMPSAVTLCRECFGASVAHGPSHAEKVAWFLCHRCDLTYSGSQSEWDQERAVADALARAARDREERQPDVRQLVEIVQHPEISDIEERGGA